MNVDLPKARWFKSSRSGTGHECVEIAHLDTGVVGVRDSKNPGSQHLVFAPDQWDIFLPATKNNEFHSVPTE